MGMARNIAIYNMIQAQQQARKKAQKEKEGAKGVDVNQGNVAGNVDQPVYGVGGETTAFNAGLLSFKKSKKEAQKLGQNNYAMVDEHQGQILLG